MFSETSEFLAPRRRAAGIFGSMETFSCIFTKTITVNDQIVGRSIEIASLRLAVSDVGARQTLVNFISFKRRESNESMKVNVRKASILL